MTDRKAKVAYILTPITFGGSEKVSLNFLRTVDRKQFDIQPVLLTRPWEEEPYFARELQQLGYAYETVPVALKKGGEPLRVLRVAGRLYSILKQGAFELVHTHGYFADICGLTMARLVGLPTISTCHGFISTDFKLKMYNLLDTYALRSCKTIIAVSDGIKSELVRSGLQDSRIEVIPNAVAPHFGGEERSACRKGKRDSLGIGSNEHVVGYIGRLSEEKGLICLVEAIAELRDDLVPVKLLIVGDGPERLALEKRVKERKLEKWVFFVGFQTDIENWFPVLDVFALPSLTEGTPMALLEAMAAGVPVVATAVGGVPKVVTDGINGSLVPSGEVGQLREKIQLLLESDSLQDRFRKEGLNTVNSKYDIHTWCRMVESVYDGICKK